MWVEAISRSELERARKLAVVVDGRELVLLWHDGAAYALDNTCIHQGGKLARGVIFKDRLVCPGHQWAYELDTGYCREKHRCQPAFRVRVEGDVVFVDTDPIPTDAILGADGDGTGRVEVDAAAATGGGAWRPSSS